MLTIQVMYKDKTFKEISANFKRQFIGIRDTVVALGKATKEKMRAEIQLRRITSAEDDSKFGNLMNNIDVYYWGGEGYIIAGVGSIKKLDEKAPYWYLVNYGGSVSKSAGTYHFVPGDFVEKRFKYDPQSNVGFYLPDGLSSNAVLPPMGYIEATKVWLESITKVLKITSTGEVRIKTT